MRDNLREDVFLQKRKEFRKDLFWSLLKASNYVLMTAAAAVLCVLFDYIAPAVPTMRFRIFLSLILFFAVYIVFCRIYQGVRVSTMSLSEMIYSQTLAALLSDLILYASLWMITGIFSHVWFLLPVLLTQFAVSFIWSFCTNRLYFRMNRPSRTILIYNHRSGLQKLIHEYGLEKKYHLETIYQVQDIMENLSILSDYETIFLSDIRSMDRNRILKYCVEHNLQMFVIPRIGDTLMSSARPMHMFHLPMLEVNGYRPSPYYLIWKRIFDVVVALLSMIILSPIFLITAIAIKATDGGPVFYKQERMTQYGRKFMIHKFRSMRVDAEKDGVARLSTGAKDDRITPVGRIIRACRIDELPQLIDILKGDLSVVGPRPEREAIALQYEETMPEFRLRLLAKAGLTGYAQVYGKYNSTPYDKLQMDLMYIAHPSFMQDLKICFATVKILFLPESTEGVEEGSATAMKKED